MRSRSVTTLLAAILVLGMLGCGEPDSKPAPEPPDTPAIPQPSTRRLETGPEGRAVWISSGHFGKEEDQAGAEIRARLDAYASIGINHLYCFSALKNQHGMDWDFLEVLLREAHARKMKVHPILCPMHLYPGYRDEILEEHPDWLIKNWKESAPCLNLALPEVRQFLIGKITEALEYDIDGIQLDGIRFQTGQGFSYDEATRAAFKEIYGKDPLELRWHNCGNMIWCEWMRWNASHVTAFVRGVKDAIRQSGKDIPLSAAVFPDPKTASFLVGQDWLHWVDEGIVDVLCPMLYSNNPEVFREYAARAVKAVDGRCAVYAGIAVSTSHDANTPEGVVEQVELSRKAGADGVVFFSGSSFGTSHIEALRRGVFGP